MANLTFRGSAKRGRQSSFDPFDVPDQTLKLQQETERTLSGMREVRSQNIQNRNEELAAIKEKNFKESSHRTEMKSLDREFADAFHAAELQHYETRISDAGTRALEAERKHNQMKELAELIPKAIQAYGEFDQARWKSALERKKTVVNQLGASGEELISFLQQTEALKYGDAGLGAAADKFFPDASSLQRRQLLDLRGYNKMALRAVAGQEVIKNHWEPFFSQWKKSKKNVSQSGNTLDEILSNPDLQVGSEAKAMRAMAERDFQQMYFMEDNPEFVKRYFQPFLDKKADEFNADLNTTLNNNRTRIDHEEEIAGVKRYMAMDPDGTQWISDFVNSAGDPSRAGKWRTLSKVLTSMATSGELTSDVLERIEATEIEINGKLTTIGESKKELLKPVNKEIHEFNNRNRTRYVEEKRNASVKALQLYEQHVDNHGRNMNKAEFTRIKDWLKSENNYNKWDYEKYAPWVKAAENREPMEIEAARQYLDGKVANNELRMMHLHLVPEDLWDEYGKKAKDGIHAIVGQDDIFSQLEKSIVAVASKSAKSKFEVRAEAQRVIDRAKQKVAKLIEPALISQTGNTATDVYQKIIDNEIQLLNNNTPGTIYERAVDATSGNIKYGNGAGFVNYHDPTSILRGYQQAVIEKQDLTGVLTEHDRTQLVNYQNKVGRMPLFLEGMAAVDPNRTPFEMAEALVAAETKGGILEPRGHEGLLRVIPPANRKLITDRGSTAKTWTAAATDPEQEDALITSFIPKDVYNYAPDNPYDVVSSSFSGNGLNVGTNIFGAEIEFVPLKNIIDAQSKGIVSEVGAFKTTKNDLLRLIGTGMASPTDFFSPELQKLFYREKVNQETSTLYANDDMFEPIPGIGQHWFTSAKEQKGELDEEMAAALSTRLDLTKIPAAVYNEFIARTVQPLKRITK